MTAAVAAALDVQSPEMGAVPAVPSILTTRFSFEASPGAPKPCPVPKVRPVRLPVTMPALRHFIATGTVFAAAPSTLTLRLSALPDPLKSCPVKEPLVRVPAVTSAPSLVEEDPKRALASLPLLASMTTELSVPATAVVVPKRAMALAPLPASVMAMVLLAPDESEVILRVLPTTLAVAPVSLALREQAQAAAVSQFASRVSVAGLPPSTTTMRDSSGLLAKS